MSKLLTIDCAVLLAIDDNCFAVSVVAFRKMDQYTKITSLKGTVQRKLRGVQNGINRKVLL